MKMRKDGSAVIPRQTCQVCGYSSDSASRALGEPKFPEEGDLTLCMNCGEIYVFGPDLNMRLPTVDDALKWNTDAFNEVSRVQRLIRAVRPLSGKDQ